MSKVTFEEIESWMAHAFDVRWEGEHNQYEIKDAIRRTLKAVEGWQKIAYHALWRDSTLGEMSDLCREIRDFDPSKEEKP